MWLTITANAAIFRTYSHENPDFTQRRTHIVHLIVEIFLADHKTSHKMSGFDERTPEMATGNERLPRDSLHYRFVTVPLPVRHAI